MREAARLKRLEAFPFARWAEVCDEAASLGHDVIRLDVGNPDLTPPSAVLDKLSQLAHDPSVHRYPGYSGRPDLRRALTEYYQTRFGVCLDPQREVFPLLGSKEGIVHLSLACVDPGDVVLVPDPGYTPYGVGARMAGGTVVPLPLRPEAGYLPDLEAVPSDAARKAVLMWLNYPNNPTGAVADLPFLQQAVEFATRHGILLCHDAAYTEIAYGGFRPPSILEIPGAKDVSIEFNSLSKTFNMCGWRVAMAVGRRDVIQTLARMKSNVDSGIFTPIQLAAVEALSTGRDWIMAQVDVFEKRLGHMVGVLRKIGLTASMPAATHYLWVDVPPGWDGEAFARRLLRETGVSVAPGSFFGEAGRRSIRISVTAPTERVFEAASRLVQMDCQWFEEVPPANVPTQALSTRAGTRASQSHEVVDTSTTPPRTRRTPTKARLEGRSPRKTTE